MVIGTILSFIPIIVMVIFGIWRGMLEASILGLGTTVLIYWINNSKLPYEIITPSLSSSINITLIIFGALLLLESVKRSGKLKSIENTLSKLKISKNEKFLVISLGLTGFFEGIAGFGTPGAIVAPLLIHFGYSPLISITSVLLFDSIFASFGATGIPIRSMVEITGVNPYFISPFVAILNTVIGGIFLYFITKEWSHDDKKRAWEIYVIMSSVLLIVSSFYFEVAAILSSLSVFLYVFITKNLEIKEFIHAWLPYFVVGGFLIIQRFLPPGILRNPFLPFLITSVFVSGYGIVNEFADVIKKIIKPFLILFFSIAAAKGMVVGENSMTFQIALATGSWLSIFSPLIGVIGAFISGSNTVSNIMFSNIFANQNFLPLLCSGGSLGNAICFFNIISAATSSKFNQPHKILKNNLRKVSYGLILLLAISLILSQIINLFS